MTSSSTRKKPTKRFSRRFFLRSTVAGAASAASIPLLSRYERFLGGGHAFAQGVGGPKRLVIFWNPQGNCSGLDLAYAPGGIDPLWPEGNKRAFSLAYDKNSPTSGRILAPLERHKDDLLLIRGLNLPTGHEHEKACGHVNADGAHGFGVMCALTGACSYKSPDGGSEVGGGISIDQFVANRVGAETPRPSMVLTCGGTKNNRRGFVSYTGPNAPVVPMGPAAAYQYAFGNAVNQEGPKLAAIRARRASALDLIREDASRIRRRLPAQERQKMDAHLDALRLLERDFDATLSCDPVPFDAPEKHFPGHFQAQARTIAAAIACDVSRVFCVMASSGGGDTSSSLRHFDADWTTNYHSTGHASGGNSDGGGESRDTRRRAFEIMVRISEFYASWIAELIDALKAIPEGTGSAFDNTVLVWATEMSHGNHGNHQWPWIVAGGRWHFENGYYWNAPTTSPYDQKHAFGDLLTAIAQAMEVPTTQFAGFSNGNPDAYAHLWKYHA